MARLRKLIIVTILLSIIIGLGSAAPQQATPDIESACLESNPDDILLERSKWYSYEAHVVSSAKAVGASDQDAELDVKCSLKVRHNSNCAYTLEFEKCSIKGSNGNDKSRKSWLDEPNWALFTEHPITFTVNGGEVRTVLAHPNDPLHFVNMKKGFISAIIIGNQPTNPDKGYETKEHRDVQGLCRLDMWADDDGKVHTEKQLGRCQLPERPQVQNSPFSVFWDMNFLKHLVNSTLVCRSMLEKNDNSRHLRKLSCIETHAGRVDSAYKTKFGLRISIQYDLLLKDSGKTNSNGEIQVDQLRQTGIEYEYEEPAENLEEDSSTAREQLEILLDETEIDLETIPKFLALVEHMRHISDLTELTHEVERCPGGDENCSRKSRGIPLYLDALVQCNRLHCVKTLKEMLSKKLVSKTFLEFALFSWLRMPLTDHRYFNEFLDMCRSSQTRFCWLGLGGLVRTYSQSHVEVPESVSQIINLVSRTLGQSCSITEVSFPRGTVTDQKPNYIITMLKTLGNMGKVILEVEPNLPHKILACAQNDGLRILPRITALQTLEHLGQALPPAILDGVASVLLNESLPVDFRVAAYEVIINTPEDSEDLAVKLATLLKNDLSTQVKAYIASDIISNQRSGTNKFWTAFEDEIVKNDVDLYVLTAVDEMDEMTTSHVTLHTNSLNLPKSIIPLELSEFGHSLLTSTIFGGHSAIPQSIISKLNLTLFGHILEFMEVGLQTTGLDGLFIRSSTGLSGMQSSGSANYMQYLSLILQQLNPPRHSASKKAKTPPVLLNQKWEENLESIYQSYQESHSDLVKPHILLYLRMLGLDLDYTTFPDIVGAIHRVLQEMNQRQKPTKDSGAQAPFSETHIINFLEAEHPFPTLMGVPVNWRTNFTLAASLDASYKVNLKQKQGEIHFKPRLGATMLNQMMLSIPGITEIGIHCKNSLFSATQFDFRGSAETGQPIKLIMLPPKTKQRPLELYRNNYLVSGGEITELDDWDAERTNHHECLGEKFVKATGMDVCVESSYLNVQDRVDKPFYLLAGRASWALSAEMEDKGIDAYTLSIDMRDTSKERFSLEIVGDAKGTVWTRDIPLKITFNQATEEFLLSLKHSDFPDFNFAITRARIQEGGEFIGYRSSIFVQDEGKQWDLNYVKSKKKEVRQDKPTNRNESPKDKGIETHLEERNVNLKTPYNEYHFKLKLHRQSNTGNLKVDSRVSYENLDFNHNWLFRILPPIFWDPGYRKAWMEFRGDWRFGQPSKGGHHKGHHVVHESKSHLSIPVTVIEVLSHHVNKPKHTMHRFNVSKVERISGKLMLFANMTYNVWRKGKEGEPVNEIRSANLTLARHSWSLESHRQGSLDAGSESEEVIRFILTGEKMIPKNCREDGKYIGWWTPESASRFDPNRWQVSYEHHLKQKQVSANDLPPDSQKEIQDDLSSEENDGHSSEEEMLTLKKPGIRNQVIHADAKLSYPYEENQENLTFKGSFQWNGGVSPAYRTFLKTFTLGSTLHSLQLDSKSLYTKSGNEKVIISHHSALTNTRTQKNQGVYDLLFRKQLQPDSCTTVFLNHSVSAHWLHFDSHVSGTCKPGKPKARLYDITIHADHPYWKELDFDLIQTFDLDMPGGEHMNLNSSTMDITVTGDWTVGKYHKKAEFQSKTDIIPTTTWELTSNKETGELDFSILAPNEYLNALNVHRKLHKTKDKIEYEIVQKYNYPDQPVDASLISHFNAKILNSHSLLLNGSVDIRHIIAAGNWLEDFLSNATMRIYFKLADPNHEFNQHMKEHLDGMTVIEYLGELVKQFVEGAGRTITDTFEVVETFSSFYEPSFIIVGNSLAVLVQETGELMHSLGSTRLGWAYHHYNINKYLLEAIQKRPQSRSQWDPKIHFTKVMYHPSFTWSKFNEWPKLDRKLIDEFVQAYYERENSFTLTPREANEHVAMIYGPSHVLTFDGQYYSFPHYNTDSCAVIVAQDVRGKTFSVLSNKESVFLLFSDMAVTVHESGRIYINTSTTEAATPFSSSHSNVEVSRVGDIIRVQSPYLRVDCDTNSEFCIFVLDPLLSGGVIGLLGNADGEQHNEFTGPTGQKVSSVSEMAAVYEVSHEPACKDIKEMAPVPAEDPQAKRRCDRVLKQVPMTHCLASAGIKEADIRPSCISDFYREGCPCATSKAFTGLCAYEGYSIDRCQFQRRPEGSTPVPNKHDSWLIKGSHQVQIVIIVEANKHVLKGKSNQALKGLETLFENIEETFTSDGGYLTPTYSLVVYGGEKDPKPHMHTQHRSSWMLQRDFMKSIREVNFEGPARGDPITAVEYAASMLSYEPSATKLILLITLDDNVPASNSEHVHDVLHLLEHNGAALYVVASYPSLERGKKIFGVRADGLIFPNIGESYSEFPRTPAAKLAAGTRGSVFSRTHLEDNKNPLYFESLAGEMLSRVRNEKGKCRQCTCSMSPWWQIQTHCKPAPNHLQHC